VHKKWNFARRAFDVLWYSASKQAKRKGGWRKRKTVQYSKQEGGW